MIEHSALAPASGILSAITGEHHAVSRTSDQVDVFVSWFRRMVAQPARTKRAPPPADEDLDLLWYGIIVIAFCVSVC